MKRPTPVLFTTGALAAVLLALATHLAHGPALVARLERGAAAALGTTGIAASFRTPQDWLTRHPRLTGGEALDDPARARAARAIAVLPGIGGVHWAGSARRAKAAEDNPALHCQERVEAIVAARSLRFAEASAAIDPASEALLDEVAAALRPCAGSTIAILGHTDAAGDEAANLALSLDRARAVREALVQRGIPRGGLRARGLGSAEPLPRLAPADAANRRIEFSVIALRPLVPTPVDTPGPG